MKKIKIKWKGEMKPIYALIYGIPAQASIIEKHCFGDCGKIIVAPLMDKVLGEVGVCRTPKEDCPYFNKEMDKPFGKINGEPVFIRKLKDKDKKLNVKKSM